MVEPPIWKICSSNRIISPIFGVKIKNVWYHHLVYIGSIQVHFPFPAIFKFNRVDLTLLRITNTKIEVCPLRSNVFSKNFHRGKAVLPSWLGFYCLVVGPHWERSYHQFPQHIYKGYVRGSKIHHGKAWLRMAGIPYTGIGIYRNHILCGFFLHSSTVTDGLPSHRKLQTKPTKTHGEYNELSPFVSNFLRDLVIPSLKLTTKTPENGWLEY